MTVSAEAKLALVEELQRCSDALTAAQSAAEWLLAHSTAERAIFAAPDHARGNLIGIAGAGVTLRQIKRLAVPLDDAGNLLVSALTNGSTVSFHSARDARVALLGDSPFTSVKVGGGAGDDLALGLMLISPATDLSPAHVKWVADVLGRCLQRVGAPTSSFGHDDPRLRRENALLFNIINAATDPILFTNMEGQLIIANTRAEMLFTAPDDVSEGRRRAVQLNNMFFSAALSRTALGEGEAGRRELLLVDPTEGSDLLFELLSTVVSDPREGTGVVSILRNITDLRMATRQIDENYVRLRAAEAEVRAERDRLNLLIDSVADPIIVTDQEGEISLMNNPAERLFTVVPGSGEDAQRIVRANDAHFTSFVSGLLSTGWETTRRGEIALIDPNTGKLVPVEALAAKMLSEVGELTAIVTILHDRTEAIERNQLYEQLKLASEELEGKVREATAELANQNELLRRQALELEQASAAKSQFLANVSHELRTPLNAILGYAAMTLQGVSGELTASQRRNLSRIDANARHLLTLINEILDITRIEAGRMPIQIVAFNLTELVREVTTELEPIIAKSGLQVVCKLPSDLPTLRTDRQKVKQILVNLLSNALKFTQKGSITIKAQMMTRHTVAVSVIDTGIGIPKGDQIKIFEDFRQVDSTPRRAYGGTGLGLSICRRLTTMLRGSLKVESRLGHGSRFTLTLPTTLKK
ncbi:MAG: PAS domain-containing hybrid sensor histidine kinase/response regulator [Acidobacteria bacterium]|nr:MAG: PAS domain-containing hybrid sensor histidine kinase/response regulator [Acidobacteriota bacterium]